MEGMLVSIEFIINAPFAPRCGGSWLLLQMLRGGSPPNRAERERESNALGAVHLSRQKWPGIRTSLSRACHAVAIEVCGRLLPGRLVLERSAHPP